MQIILSSNCHYLAGGLGARYGYAVRKRNGKFHSCRYSRGTVPPDGHWRFIVACAKLAQLQLTIADIRVSEHELLSALREANIYGVAPVGTYNATRLLEFKNTYRL